MKRLYRSRKNRMLGGVCGGIAEYFDIDPVIVRLVAVALFFVGGSAILAYIIALIIIPYESFEASSGQASNLSASAETAAAKESASPANAAPRSSANDSIPLFLGILLIVIGGLFLMHNLPFFSPFYHQIRYYVRDFFWPSVLVVFGVFLIARGWKR